MSKRKLGQIAVIALFAVISALGNAKLLDPRSTPDFVLDSLTNELDKKNIDTARNLNSDEAKNSPLIKPRLGRLNKLPELYEMQSGEIGKWIKDFDKGIVGGLAALKNDENKISERKFFDEWKSKNKNERIFISFTRDDYPVARKIENVLVSQGYVVFTYLKSDNATFTTMERVGAYYGSAGHTFVIDTENARRSKGVAMEFALLSTLAKGGGPGSGSPIDSATNPKRGYYVNIASYKKKENAIVSLIKLWNIGHESSITELKRKGITWYKLSSGPFSNFLEASKVKDSISNEFDISDTWISKQGKSVDYAKTKRYSGTKTVSGSVDLLFYYSPYCHHSAWQKPKIRDFQKSHPDVNVVWRKAGNQTRQERNLLKGTHGYPVMVFHDGNSKRQVVGETSLMELNQHYKEFEKDINKSKRTGRSSSHRRGSGIICY